MKEMHKSVLKRKLGKSKDEINALQEKLTTLEAELTSAKTAAYTSANTTGDQSGGAGEDA